MSTKTRILFLAANPKDSSQLRLDEEIREIQDRIRAAEFRDTFDLVSRWAVRPRDLLHAFNELKPHIVHFSGHGSCNAELVLEDESGNAKPVGDTALAALFNAAKDNIRLVLLNVCNSEGLARVVSQQVECTVGMKTGIGDEAAIVFASTFYGALAFGRSVGQAFDQGRTALMLEGIREENTPVLLARPDVDALRVDFTTRKPVNPVLPPIALEILRGAVAGNTTVNYVRYDGGVAVLAGARQFDCKFNMEQAAVLDNAVTMLVQVGWLKQADEQVYNVTLAGYEAARQFTGGIDPAFAEIAEQMPELIAEMKTDLQREDCKFVRELAVIPKKSIPFNSSKARFLYYEDEHPNLRGKLDILENRGYIADVTPGNTPIYRMSEDFVRLVLAS